MYAPLHASMHGAYLASIVYKLRISPLLRCSRNPTVIRIPGYRPSCSCRLPCARYVPLHASMHGVYLASIVYKLRISPQLRCSRNPTVIRTPGCRPSCSCRLPCARYVPLHASMHGAYLVSIVYKLRISPQLRCSRNPTVIRIPGCRPSCSCRLPCARYVPLHASMHGTYPAQELIRQKSYPFLGQLFLQLSAGLEPATYALRMHRTTNCAMKATNLNYYRGFDLFCQFIFYKILYFYKNFINLFWAKNIGFHKDSVFFILQQFFHFGNISCFYFSV